MTRLGVADHEPVFEAAVAPIGEPVEHRPPQTDSVQWPWKAWTKHAVCAQALYDRDGGVEATIAALTPLLGTTPALTFTRNADWTRIPFDLDDDHEHEQAVAALRYQVRAVSKDVDEALRQRDAARAAAASVWGPKPVR